MLSNERANSGGCDPDSTTHTDVARHAHRFGLEARDAKVAHLRGAVGGDENVERVEIAVDDVLMMQVAHCGTGVGCNLRRRENQSRNER